MCVFGVCRRIKMKVKKKRKLWFKIVAIILAVLLLGSLGLTILTSLISTARASEELDELQEAINQNGATDEYQNGANQFGSKASAELQAYNTTVKNYNSLMK